MDLPPAGCPYRLTLMEPQFGTTFMATCYTAVIGIITVVFNLKSNVIFVKKNWRYSLLKHTKEFTHFMPLISVYNTSKQNLRFFMFSGGINNDQWHETG